MSPLFSSISDAARLGAVQVFTAQNTFQPSTDIPGLIIKENTGNIVPVLSLQDPSGNNHLSFNRTLPITTPVPLIWFNQGGGTGTVPCIRIATVAGVVNTWLAITGDEIGFLQCTTSTSTPSGSLIFPGAGGEVLTTTGTPSASVTNKTFGGTVFFSVTSLTGAQFRGNADPSKRIYMRPDSFPGSATLTITSAITAARTATFPDLTILVAGSAAALTAGRIPIIGAGGILADDADLTFSVDTLSATKVAMSSLTSGRVPFASAAGLLVDDADLTFAADTLSATKLATSLLKIAAAAAPGSPAVGDVWNDSTQKALAEYQGIKEFLSGCIFVQTGDVTVGNTLSELTLLSGAGSLSLPTDFLVVGKTLRLHAWGYYSTNSPGTDTPTLRVKIGSVAVANITIPFTSGVTTKAWELRCDITCRSTGASGTTMAQGALQYNDGATPVQYHQDLLATATATVDTTAAAAFDLTMQHSVANASDTFTCTNATIEVLN